MLVLDVTGSMDQDIDGNNTSDDAERKIIALRDAVMALYDELAPIQAQLQAQGPAGCATASCPIRARSMSAR